MERSVEVLGWRSTLRYLSIIYFVVCSLACLPLVPAPGSGIPADDMDPKLAEENGDENEEKKACLEKDTETTSVNKKDKEERNRKVSQISTTSSITTFKSFLMLVTAWITCSAFFLSALAQTFHFVNFVSIWWLFFILSTLWFLCILLAYIMYLLRSFLANDCVQL